MHGLSDRMNGSTVQKPLIENPLERQRERVLGYNR